MTYFLNIPKESRETKPHYPLSKTESPKYFIPQKSAKNYITSLVSTYTVNPYKYDLKRPLPVNEDAKYNVDKARIYQSSLKLSDIPSINSLYDKNTFRKIT